jgi:hypothetical protein
MDDDKIEGPGGLTINPAGRRVLDDEIARLRADNERLLYNTKPLLERTERMEKALRDIESWAKAYPVERFLEPSSDQMRQAELALRGSGVSLAAINASAMRHVLDGVINIVKDGLGDG